MATLAKSADWIWNDDREPLRLKFCAALVRVAVEVTREDAGTARHAERLEVARQIIASEVYTEGKLSQLRKVLCSDDTVVGVGAPTLTDEIILTAVRGAFDSLI